MSIEEILVLVLFVGVPLVQFLLRVLKQGTGQRAPLPPPPLPKLPPLPARQPAVLKQPVLPQPKPVPATKPPVVVSRPAQAEARRSMRPMAMSAGLRNPRELRRAIALTTILGPCRANSPYDGPATSG